MNHPVYTTAYNNVPRVRTRANSLPVQLTPLIGREKELLELSRLLDDRSVRLLTLTGPPGVGKSRLALHAANSMLDNFPDGAYSVEVRDEDDTAGVLARIAMALPLDYYEPQGTFEAITGWLQGKQTLLLLQDFEQAIEAAPMLLDLLLDCPGLQALVTSRSPLYVHGEHVFPVSPLSLPGGEHADDPGHAQVPDAVTLFAERARSVKPSFVLSQENARLVADICTAVDGLPLAVELAAARINLMPLPAIEEWLRSHPLDLLVTPGPHLPGSQKDLRSTLERSYRLLSAEEQALFRHLSVFVGSCTLEAAQAVCGEENQSDAGASTPTGAARRAAAEVLESAQSLSDKGLLYYKEQRPGVWRLSMLGLIRQFAREMLEARGELEAALQKHARYFAAVAEQIDRDSMTSHAKDAYDRVEADQPNLMSALDWAMSAEERLELAATIAASSYFFWEARNFCKEGLGRLEALAVMPSMQARTNMRAKILNGVGRLRLFHSTPGLASQAFEEAFSIYRETGDPIGESIALVGLALVARKLGDVEKARGLAQEALRLRRQNGHRWLMAQSITHLAVLATEAGEPEYAAALTVRGIALFKSMDANCWVTMLMESLDKLCAELAYQIQAPDSLDDITDGLDELWEVHKPSKYMVEQVAQSAQGVGVDIIPVAGKQSENGYVGAEAADQAGGPVESDLSALTPREVEVLRLLARGLTNARMAEELMVSRHTVDVHIRSIYGKINVHSRSAATRIALAEGLV